MKQQKEKQNRGRSPERERQFQKLKETLQENREVYIRMLKKLVAIDTHDIGHGIGGGLEQKGQEFLIHLLSSMGADAIDVDPMSEAVIEECLEKER